MRHAAALPVVLSMLDEPAVRRDAIRALASFDAPQIAPTLIQRYAKLSAAEKSEVVTALSARRSTAQALVAELKKKTIPKTDVTAFDARQLYRVLGPSFVEFWVPITQLASDKQAEMAKYKAMLTDPVIAKANTSKGRAIFERTCMGCHMLYGAGGIVGPDLTGSNRANLDYILAQIINPSEVMQESYQLVIVTTRDGRTLSGTVAAEDNQQLTLPPCRPRQHRHQIRDPLPRKIPHSMMPRACSKPSKTTKSAIDRLPLRTTAQVPLPK